MKTVIERELLDHLRSIQFAALLAMSTILFLANGVLSAKKYSQQITLYNQRVSQSYQNPSTISLDIYRKPSQLMFLAEGGDKNRPYGYVLKPKGVLDALPSGHRNFKLPDIPEIDWSFIVKVIFSLYIILLSYSAISGEKEQGTLRLIFSNSMGRVKLLVAKYISILLTVIIPLVTGIILSLIIIGIFIPKILTLNILSRILVMFLLTLVYLSVFALLSLTISSLIHRSSLGLLVLLALWVLFAILIPNASDILSQRFSNVPSEYQMAKSVGPMIEKQVWARINEIRERVKKGELKTEEEVKREVDRAFKEGQEEVFMYYKNYENAMKRRAETAQKMSRLSPTALFQYALESIAQTGAEREKQFIKDVYIYAKTYDDYILKKVGKLVGTSPWHFSSRITINEKSIYISSPMPEEYLGDKSDFPHFVESEPSLGSSIRNALFDIAALLLWNIFLAILAFSSFFHMDVR